MLHEITTAGTGERSKAICTCGWTGPSRETRAEALADARQHKAARPLATEDGQRLLLLRERARTRQGQPSWDDVDFALLILDRVRRQP